MEIILAIVVASAVIFFGALISMGNERQRKAIDLLREQVALWATQDLRIKRETLTQEVQVGNPLEWLIKNATKAYGNELRFQIDEIFDQPQALSCKTSNGQKIIFTILSPSVIKKIKHRKLSRLSQYSNPHPLLSLPRDHNVEIYELSILNNGILFDLEFPIVWNGITGQKINDIKSAWMYIIKE